LYPDQLLTSSADSIQLLFVFLSTINYLSINMFLHFLFLTQAWLFPLTLVVLFIASSMTYWRNQSFYAICFSASLLLYLLAYVCTKIEFAFISPMQQQADGSYASSFNPYFHGSILVVETLSMLMAIAGAGIYCRMVWTQSQA
jgi:hypothetical protein